MSFLALWLLISLLASTGGGLASSGEQRSLEYLDCTQSKPCSPDFSHQEAQVSGKSLASGGQQEVDPASGGSRLRRDGCNTGQELVCSPATSSPPPTIDQEEDQEEQEEATRAASSGDNKTAIINRLELYSRQNLATLLPSLRVIPAYWEAEPGDQVQLACVTGGLDPDPDPSELEWSFEWLPADRGRLLEVAPRPQPELPPNITGSRSNLLTLWNFTSHHVGLYKCRHRLRNFQLQVEATGELGMKPGSLREADQLNPPPEELPAAAPLVWLAPELLRLSQAGSAQLQCEASGWPRPQLGWYRLEALGGASVATDPSSPDEEGAEVEQVPAQDAGLYCRHHKCQAPASARITAVSRLLLRRARARHQGQWVCRASNQHGTNQASALVDVDFREPPRVSLAPESRLQVIVLSAADDPKKQAATFRCRIEAGRPRPRLSWLRVVSGGSSQTVASSLTTNEADHFYQLPQVSSATSNVSVRLESDGQELVLEVRTAAPDDEGLYLCVGENEWGRHTELARLQVRRPASVRVVQQSPFIAKPGDSFQLECLASGHPAPADVEWSRQDRGAFFSLISSAQTANMAARQQQLRAVLRFDRVGVEEAGEYACLARDPLAPPEAPPLRDTIMVVVRDAGLGGDNDGDTSDNGDQDDRQLPRLMVSPSKATIARGSNLTLDCLAVAGHQPILVEWQAPEAANQSAIRPYYLESAASMSAPMGLLQLGSRLRIVNASRRHEGLYQCRGRNRAGAEVAPALVKLVDGVSAKEDEEDQAATIKPAKTKVASVGANIELKCQLRGATDNSAPAISWSRDGRQLPPASVQMGPNLWIQNVSLEDGGLYVCALRQPPGGVLQARINLLVRPATAGSASWPQAGTHQLQARIVASKQVALAGDSITLECIVGSGPSGSTQEQLLSPIELEELERSVVWTSPESGGSFPSNVYTSNNLLIIYKLRLENSGAYRCNYNELAQHTDHQLAVVASNSNSTGASTSISNSSIQVRQATLGQPLKLDCPFNNQSYHWTRGSGDLNQRRLEWPPGKPLHFAAIQAAEADLYQCHSSDASYRVLVQVGVPAARFLQRPVSFVSLPAQAGAGQRLELELALMPERPGGLILFSGPSNHTTGSGDYIALGLVRGHLEFRFELGDGATSLRSPRPLALNQWHRVSIERSRRGAVMRVEGQQAVANQSAGKFFNLNLDSVLYVGGHHHFLNQSGGGNHPFQGHRQGFQGCVGHLRLGGRLLDLLARNRSVSVGVAECGPQRQEAGGECQALGADCVTGQGVCQLLQPHHRNDPWARCICLPGFGGRRCESAVNATLTTINSSEVTNCQAQSKAACHPEGTLSCQPLSSSAHRCHCKLGFAGPACQQSLPIPANATSLHFAAPAYLHLLPPSDHLATAQAQQTAESQNISLVVRTTSSYGLLLYMGHQQPTTDAQLEPLSSTHQQVGHQPSKSMVANLLSRLSAPGANPDYLALALVDGHVELSYELGSGPAVLRSSQRLNDSLPHRLQVQRQGKWARLTIDELHKHEGQSPGRLSALNVPGDIYLGGLPRLDAGPALSSFTGCLSQLHLGASANPMRPLEGQLVRGARNLAPCLNDSPIAQDSSSPSSQPVTGGGLSKTTSKPYKPPTTTAEPSDDPDEM